MLPWPCLRIDQVYRGSQGRPDHAGWPSPQLLTLLSLQQMHRLGISLAEQHAMVAVMTHSIVATELGGLFCSEKQGTISASILFGLPCQLWAHLQILLAIVRHVFNIMSCVTHSLASPWYDMISVPCGCKQVA